jgi:hypothetical protein
MNQIINLNRARKRAKRDQDETRAQENRLLHGRTKAEIKLNQAESDTKRRRLDAHRIEKGDDA